MLTLDEEARMFAQQHQYKSVGKQVTSQGQVIEAGKPDTQSWVSSTKWQKPTIQRDTLNQYIGSGQKQILILKQEPLIAVKTEAPTITAQLVPQIAKVSAKTTPAVIVGLNTKPSIIMEQKVANPFLQYQGKPYYRTAQKEAIEYAQVSYPQTTRTQSLVQSMPQLQRVTPVQNLVPIQKVTPIIKATPITKVEPIQVPISSLDIIQVQTQLQESTQVQSQVQEQVQEQTQALLSEGANIGKYYNKPLGGSGGGGGPSKYDPFAYFGVISKKRVYPIFTPYEVVKGRKWTSPKRKRRREE
jgi:hypothetical protein